MKEASFYNYIYIFLLTNDDDRRIAVETFVNKKKYINYKMKLLSYIFSNFIVIISDIYCEQPQAKTFRDSFCCFQGVNQFFYQIVSPKQHIYYNSIQMIHKYCYKTIAYISRERTSFFNFSTILRMPHQVCLLLYLYNE